MQYSTPEKEWHERKFEERLNADEFKILQQIVTYIDHLRLNDMQKHKCRLVIYEKLESAEFLNSMTGAAQEENLEGFVDQQLVSIKLADLGRHARILSAGLLLTGLLLLACAVNDILHGLARGVIIQESITQLTQGQVLATAFVLAGCRLFVAGDQHIYYYKVSGVRKRRLVALAALTGAATSLMLPVLQIGIVISAPSLCVVIFAIILFVIALGVTIRMK